MKYLDLMIIALASFRLARMVARENGPFNIFTKIRSRYGASLNAEGTKWEGEPGTIGDMLSCDPCLQVWFAVLLLPTIIYESLLSYAMLPFALSGLALMFRRFDDGW